MKKFLLTLILMPLIASVDAQKINPNRLENPDPIICHAEFVSKATRIYAPKPSAKNARTQAATFQVNYNGFTTEAQAAFQAAVDIWAGLISSPVTIRIDATWEQLESGVLGSAGASTLFSNFEGALVANTWYPPALAEKMAGQDINDPSNPDIVASFNSDANWYLGTDGNPSASEFDLVSVVLHEIGHGLGFFDSFDFDSGSGSFGFQSTAGNTLPVIYDQSVINGSQMFLVSDFTNPSTELGDELTGNDLFFDSPTAEKVTGATPRLFAPASWNPGSSIAHLDENTYPSGNENSLMTPQIGQNEVMQDPGPITLNMFGDMGWEYTYINHTQIPNSEDFGATSYSVVASINSDIEYETDSVILYYSIDEFQSDTTEVFLTPTANPDEYTGDITSNNVDGQIYTYYLVAIDTNSRRFSKPSLVPLNFFSFTTQTDNEAPEITHNPPGFISDTDTELVLEATVKDFSALASVEVEYFINDQAGQMGSMVLIDESDSLYSVTIDLSGETLADGDSVRYNITATDAAGSSNSSIFPATGLIKLDVLALQPAAADYSNNFDDEASASNDFFTSNNFRIETPTGFSNGAIHSDHPYADGTGPSSESNYTYELKIPIILNTTDALMNFDEVVLVEPGESGTNFGDAEFWDYVIVEGSNDGGVTWEPFEDGYDSRDDEDWLATYNGNIVGSDSEALGDASLYQNRTIDMLANTSFVGGEEILIRFRLFADAAAHGWGWAIDNLNIQIDQTSPTILHNHIDYVTSNTAIDLSATVTDNFAVDSVIVVNNQGTPIISTQGSGADIDIFTATLNIGAATLGDTIEYQIVAFDSADPANIVYLPGESSFFKVPFIEFDAAVSIYENDFNSPSTDFVGNFFNISQPASFSNGAIHTDHPYVSGFGTNGMSSFTYTLKTPILVDAINHYLGYDEVLLAPAGDAAILEASSDNGATWSALDSYQSSSQSAWLIAVNDETDGNEGLFFERVVDLGQFSTGEEVLIRFRLENDNGTNSWGWAIDNLQIQTNAVTSLSKEVIENQIAVYPNPIANDQLQIDLQQLDQSRVNTIDLINSNGIKIQSVNVSNEKASYEVNMSGLPSGIYLLKLNINNRYITKRILKLD